MSANHEEALERLIRAVNHQAAVGITLEEACRKVVVDVGHLLDRVHRLENNDPPRPTMNDSFHEARRKLEEVRRGLGQAQVMANPRALWVVLTDLHKTLAYVLDSIEAGEPPSEDSPPKNAEEKLSPPPTSPVLFPPPLQHPWVSEGICPRHGAAGVSDTGGYCFHCFSDPPALTEQAYFPPPVSSDRPDPEGDPDE